jgi:hypothetical protein
MGKSDLAAVGNRGGEGKRCPGSLYIETTLTEGEITLDQAMGIIGQAVLLLTGVCLVILLVLLCLVGIKAIRRLLRELRQPLLPPVDSYVPRPFDLP